MTYEMYRSIFTGCAVAGGIMAGISILLFFWLKIPAVIGDLTGISARKGIEEIRNGNIRTGNKKYGSSKVNLQRGKLTAKISPSGSLKEMPENRGYGINTEKLSSGETTVLPQSVSNETTVLPQPQNNETTVLPQPQNNETTVLSQVTLPSVQSPVFEILQEITFIHTEECIEITEISTQGGTL